MRQRRGQPFAPNAANYFHSLASTVVAGTKGWSICHESVRQSAGDRLGSSGSRFRHRRFQWLHRRVRDRDGASRGVSFSLAVLSALAILRPGVGGAIGPSSLCPLTSLQGLTYYPSHRSCVAGHTLNHEDYEGIVDAPATTSALATFRLLQE